MCLDLLCYDIQDHNNNVTCMRPKVNYVLVMSEQVLLSRSKQASLVLTIVVQAHF